MEVVYLVVVADQILSHYCFVPAKIVAGADYMYDDNSAFTQKQSKIRLLQDLHLLLSH